MLLVPRGAEDLSLVGQHSEVALFLGFQGRAEGGYHALESVVGELRI